MNTPIVACQQVSFRYGSEDAVTDISFALAAGDYVGIVGSNGSGKTTLLKLLLGLLTPSSGSIELFGVPLAQFHDWYKIGYVPQNVFRGDLNFPATVREVVESGHLDAREGRWCQFGSKNCAAVTQALTRSRITHLADKRIGELSGGERQRVFIARALVSQPQLLVLDEPTANVDVTVEEQFYAFLEELNQSGMTIILVSHDLEAIARQVKTVLCLNRNLVCYGKPENLEKAEVLHQMYGAAGKQILHHKHAH